MESIKTLREKTGAGILDCKNALEKTSGDLQEATEILRKKGFQVAEKKALKETLQGRIGSYIHFNGKIGVLVELACETDFVARNELMDQLLKDLSMQIAATNPIAISRDDLPSDIIEKQEESFRSLASDKPPHIQQKVVQGKMESFFREKCLLEQPFIKDETLSVRDVLTDCIAKVGENIKIKRFVRFAIGES